MSEDSATYGVFPPEQTRKVTKNSIVHRISNWLQSQWDLPKRDTDYTKVFILMYKLTKDQKGYPYGIELDIKEAIELHKELEQFLLANGEVLKRKQNEKSNPTTTRAKQSRTS